MVKTLYGITAICMLVAFLSGCRGTTPRQPLVAQPEVGGDSVYKIRLWRVVGANDSLSNPSGNAGSRMTDAQIEAAAILFTQQVNAPSGGTATSTSGLFGPNVRFELEGSPPSIRVFEDPSLFGIPLGAARPAIGSEDLVENLKFYLGPTDLVDYNPQAPNPIGRVVNVFFAGYRSALGNPVVAYAWDAEEMETRFQIDPVNSPYFGLAGGIIVVNDDFADLREGQSYMSSRVRYTPASLGPTTMPGFSFMQVVPHEMGHLFGSWARVGHKFIGVGGPGNGSSYDANEHDTHWTNFSRGASTVTPEPRFLSSLMKSGTRMLLFGDRAQYMSAPASYFQVPLIVPGQGANLGGGSAQLLDWDPSTDLGYVWRRLRVGEAFTSNP